MASGPYYDGRQTEESILRRFGSIALVLAGLLGSAAASAQPAPAQNISARRHPNLAAAQHLVDQAFQRISAAQRANEFDMEGHAVKAKELLDEANKELREATNFANKNK
jgi:hypothetical protein